MADTFTWVPSKSFTKSTKPRVTIAQFGDGYSQRSIVGINSMTREWSISFNSKDINTVNLIENFFIDKQGVEAFNWVPPGETTTYFVICTEWSRTYDSHISASLQAKFVQVFDSM